ncbi:MAG: PAC2 family protein, partial [Actinomycetota bacterium]
MSLYEVRPHDSLTAPALVAALDGWVDAGSCGTQAAEYVARDGEVLVEFDVDALVDFRARRPILDIEGGRLTEFHWPRLTVRRVRFDLRDVLVLTGPEPDYRWKHFRRDLVELARELAVVESVSLGAIPAMVPHTRPTPVLTTGSAREGADTGPPLPAEHLRVPAAAVNLVEVALAEEGIRSGGFWAQVPHYVAGAFTAGALALVERVSAHLNVVVSVDELVEEAR